jgi:hypothetical protein
MPTIQGVRRPVTVISTDTPTMDEFGDFVTSQLLPPYARLAAAGMLFAADASAGTAKAPVVAPPTTSPEWALYNASPTHTLVLLGVAANIKSGTQGLGLSLLVCSAVGPQTAVSADYTAAVKSCLDGSNRKPDVYITNNPTLIGAQPSWVTVAADGGNIVAQVNIASGLVAADLGGRFIAKPNGGMVAMEVVGATGTSALYWPTFVFAMLPLSLT